MSIRIRLEKKIEVLKLWVRDGVPPGKQAPVSLAKLRVWCDIDLGVEAIGHINAVTKTHQKFGFLVVEAERLMAVLAKSPLTRSRSARRSLTAMVEEQRREIEELRRTNQSLVSQWHMARSEAQADQKRAIAFERRLQDLLKDIQENEANNVIKIHS